MKTILFRSGHLEREIKVEPFEALPGFYFLQVNSKELPEGGSEETSDAWKRNFGLLLRKRDLKSLRDAISGVL